MTAEEFSDFYLELNGKLLAMSRSAYPSYDYSDVLQDMWLGLWKVKDRYSEFSTRYLWRRFRWKIQNAAAANKFIQEDDIYFNQIIDSKRVHPSEIVDLNLVLDTISDLQQTDIEILKKVAINGETAKEAKKSLDCSEAAVRVRLFDARRRLANKLPELEKKRKNRNVA